MKPLTPDDQTGRESRLPGERAGASEFPAPGPLHVSSHSSPVPGQPPAGHPPCVDSDETGLPVLHSWKTLYLFVLASFALWIALLIALTKSFS